MKRVLFLLWPLALAACDSAVPSAPAPTPRAVFDDFWEGMDRYAGNLEILGVDWDSVRAVHADRFTPDLTDAEVFAALVDVAYAPRDPHIRLLTPEVTFQTLDSLAAEFGWTRTFDDARVRQRLGASAVDYADGRILTGQIGDIGYIWVRDFSGGLGDTWFDQLDVAADALRESRAYIVDIRDNDGGNGIRSRDVAGRFMSQPRLFLRTQQRIGRGDTDFTAPFEHIVRPRGDQPLAGPVVVLTSRYTISAAERFLVAMRERPDVTVVGDTTAGTLGGTHERELLNGWLYSLSYERVTDARGCSYDGTGIPPDIVQRPEPGRDAVLERALELLR